MSDALQLFTQLLLELMDIEAIQKITHMIAVKLRKIIQ